MSTASVRPGDLVVSGQRVELQLTSISACTLRVSLLPIAVDGSVQPATKYCSHLIRLFLYFAKVPITLMD